MNSNPMSRLLALFAILILITACSKEAGEGGLASIRGKVWVKDYDDSFTLLRDEYYAQDEEVFIIYGDDVSVGERVRTSYDGWYEFQYLRPGTYTVFCYSDDSTLQTLAKIPVLQEVEIQGRKDVVVLPDLVIFK
jgi:hypothetical protein